MLLGSPHFSLAEFRQLAPLLNEQVRHPGVRFLVTTSRAVTALAERAGLLEPLRRFGGQLTVDTCPLATPMLPPEIRTLMTNSAKYAYYAPGLLNTQVIYGSLADCVRSAVEGRVVRDETLWKAHDPGPPRGGGRGSRPVALQRRAAELLGRLRCGNRRNHRPAASALGAERAGRVLAIPFTKGSSTTTAVFLEAVRAGTAPAAVLTAGTDAFLALASIVADEMYGRPVPIVALAPEDFAALGRLAMG